jgi:hypothetical protein
MRPSNWTPERDALLRELRASDMPRPEMLARINDGFEPQVTLSQMVERARTIRAKRGEPVVSNANHFAAGPRYRSDAEYRTMSDQFAQAGRDLRLQEVAFAPPPRQGIMSGKPPNYAEMVAARVAMAERTRCAVSILNVRGMV